MLKKIWKFLSSMRFAIFLLLILIASCAAGSFLTQGQSYEWYAATYSERSAAIIMALYLDDMYHSWWFVSITALLCCNLLLCSLRQLPALRRRTRNARRSAQLAPTVTLSGVADPAPIFDALRMKPAQADTGELFAAKNRIGFWGAWICHLGILLLILGFGLGQMTHREYTVYGVAGQTKPVGDSGYSLTIDDFRVDLREDDTVEQYAASITMTSADGAAQGAAIRVNEPATLFGMKCYQNSTGWAATVTVEKSGETLQETLLCAGECCDVADMPELTLCFRAFYPDYVLIPGQGPATASGRLNNPAYLYAVSYRDELLGMNALTDGETITIDSYTIRFSNPQNYTLIQIKRDDFTWLALLGGLIAMLGLFFALYLPPQALRARREDDGTWTVEGESRKGGVLFAERLRAIAEQKEET